MLCRSQKDKCNSFLNCIIFIVCGLSPGKGGPSYDSCIGCLVNRGAPSYASTITPHKPPLSASSIILQTSCMRSKCGGSRVVFCATNVHISKKLCLPLDISPKCLLLLLSENANHKICRQFLCETTIRLCQITVQVIFTVSEIVLLSDLSKLNLSVI